MNRFVFQFNSLIGKIGFLLLTFVIGVASTLLLFQNSPPTVSVNDLPSKVTLCQLAQNSQSYDGKTVQIEGDATDQDGLIYISDNNCKMVELQRAQDYKPDAEAQELSSKLHLGNFKARVSGTGKFDPEGTQGCFGTKFSIRAMSVKLK